MLGFSSPCIGARHSKLWEFEKDIKHGSLRFLYVKMESNVYIRKNVCKINNYKQETR